MISLESSTHIDLEPTYTYSKQPHFQTGLFTMKKNSLFPGYRNYELRPLNETGFSPLVLLRRSEAIFAVLLQRVSEN